MYKLKPFVAKWFIIRYISMKTLKTLFVAVFLLVSTQATLAVTAGELTTSSASNVACTMDAKLCPDGVTYVGRVAPKCEFAACPNVSPCVDIKTDLRVNSTDATTGGDVTKLQTFLAPQYLKVEPTGRFLGLTRAAVVDFQKQYGISPAFGNVGPITRAKIKELTCGGGGSQTLHINSIEPSIAKVGQTVALSGPGLNSGGDFILFDGHRIETDGSKALNRVGFVVPEYITNTINCITTPCPLGFSKKVVPGTYTVQVVNNLGTTNTVKLTVIDSTISPSDTIKISRVEPSAAKVGASAIIYGYNLFRPETRILFDGMSIPGKPVYTKMAGNFNSALEFVVPGAIIHTINCITTPCPQPLPVPIVPGTYELAVDNKYGRDSVKFEVLSETVGGKPYLSYLNPTQGSIGTEVAIFGQNINTGNEKIYFGGSLVPSTSLVTDRKGVIRFKVPQSITPCGYDDSVLCRMVAQQVTPGKYDVVVKNKEGISNTLTFTVTSGTVVSAPKLYSLTPSAGSVGREVVIKGEGINVGSDQIYFGGSRVTPTLSSDAADIVNTLRFKVPSEITPCGVNWQQMCEIATKPVVPGLYEVVVVNKNGTSNALNFTVTSGSVQVPIITSLSPQSGPVDTRVTVYGSNIDTGAEYVLFAGYRLPVDGAKVAGRVSFIVPRELAHPCVQLKPTDPCPAVMVRLVTPGNYTVAVGNANGVSTNLNFTVTGTVSTDLVITSFYATDYTFTNGNAVGLGRKLVWTTTGAQSCEASGAWSGSKPTNGEHVIGFMSQPLTYTLTCYNNKGISVTKSVTDPATGTTQVPVISTVFPSSVSVGTEVSLTGERLNTGNAKIVFGSGYITPNPTRSSDSVLVFTIPAMMPRYCAPGLYCTDDMISVNPGTYDVKVINSFGTSNAKSVSVVASTALTPSISAISPSVGGTNVQVTLSGSNFNPSSDYVWFGSLKIAPNRNTGYTNALTFTVPTTLFQCDVKPGEECLARYEPTPAGYYQIKVENSAGRISNAVNYQVTGGSSF